MTPKEKAKDLIDKFARIDGYQDSIDLSKCEYEKQCALITVNEMLNTIGSEIFSEYKYWQEVKQEIEKI